MFIHQTLARAVRLFGTRQAVVCGEMRLTYRELEQRIARFTAALVAAGVQPGDRIATLMLNCHRYLECYFAAERAGAVLQPLNHRLAPAEVAYALNDARAVLLVAGPELWPVVEVCRAQLTTVRQVIVATDTGEDSYEARLARSTPVDAPVRTWAEEDLVHLYYTSGTTGRAKGVMLSQRNVMSNAHHALFAHRFTEQDVWLHAAPMFHLADAWACWAVTWIGGRHVFLREFQPSAFLSLVEREQVSVTLVVPTMINAIVNLPEADTFDVSSLRLITFGASPMPVDRLTAAMQALPCQFSQLYGMTETSPFATQLLAEDIMTATGVAPAERLASCGREIPGVEVRVQDAHGQDVRPGVAGEIVMRGPNVMLGYWERPDETAHALRNGWMHSGDLATVDASGYITIVDRAKDMIITGGENVYSTEVEDALYRHAAVLEAAVIGVPDDLWGERVHAVIVLRPGARTTAEDLADSCRRFIAGFKIPRSVEFVESLPKTGSGKIQKSELRARHWRGRGRRVN